MKFTSKAHEDFYNDHAAITARGDDYKALIYTLGIDQACREHFSRLYDPADRVIIMIITAWLFEGWQTGASRRITRLAFHLFTWQTAEGDDPAEYTPRNLFSNLDETHRQGALLALAYFA